MFRFRPISSDYNPSAWDIEDQDGRRYSWGGDLYSALREAVLMEREANRDDDSERVEYDRR